MGSPLGDARKSGDEAPRDLHALLEGHCPSPEVEVFGEGWNVPDLAFGRLPGR